MTILNENQLRKVAEVEQHLTSATDRILELKNSYKKDIRKDIYDYFVGRLSTFRESDLNARDAVKTSAIHRFSSKHNIVGGSFPSLTKSIESLESFFKEIKQFETAEKMTLKSDSWLKTFEERLKT